MLQLAHAHVANSDYNIVITLCVTSERLHIFKYNLRRCEYEVFDNQADAIGFINRSL
jgi:hypothetical protein